MILSKKRITKALIRLRGCAGWSAPVLFAKPRRQVFSRRGPYDVRNVKLQLYTKGLVWSRGESTSVKLFLFSICGIAKNRVFNPYFSIGICPMRKRLLWISRGMHLLSFSWKKISFSLKLFSGHFYGQSFIKTVRGPLLTVILGVGGVFVPLTQK